MIGRIIFNITAMRAPRYSNMFLLMDRIRADESEGRRNESGRFQEWGVDPTGLEPEGVE
jgi:hypothetical protein